MPDKDKKTESEVSLADEAKEEVSKDDTTTSSESKTIPSFSLLDSDKPSETPKEEATEKKDSPKLITEELPDEEKAPDATAKNSGEISSDEVKKWLEDVRPDTTKVQEKGGSFNWKAVFIGLFVVALIGALVGGIYYYRTSLGQPAAPDTPTAETGTATDTSPSATPSPEELKPSDYSLQVLNGSGIAGEAGRAEDLLTEAGFENVDTGNAGTYDFEETQVSLKAGVNELLFEKIKEALSSGYVVEMSENTLEDSSSYDAVITVGKKKP